MPNKFTEVQRILDNPNGCLMVPELLAAIADECAKIGAKPFNTMGGHFVWQAIARDVGQCALDLKDHKYDRHLIYADPTTGFSDVVGLR